MIQVAEMEVEEDIIATRLQTAKAGTHYLLACIEAAPAVIPDEGILAGPDGQLAAVEGLKNPGGLDDNLHFPMDVGNLLSLGVPGIAETARTNGASMEYERREYLECIADTFDGITSYIERHAGRAREMLAGAAGEERERLRVIADNCATLSLGPPVTFMQAVQLFWFVHIIRGRNRWASTIGRLDQHLYPFYQADISEGRITREEALEVLCELWRGFNRQVDHPSYGLLNLVVGGQDAEGNDATNDVSCLIIDASLSVSDTNPFVSVRIHDRTPPAFIDKVCELHLVGQGQGTVYNDEIIIPALVEYGIPLELARIYANDGCNEITIDGCSTIALSFVDALKSLELALFDGKECPSARQEPKRHCATTDRPVEHHLAKPGFESGHLGDDASFEDVFEAFMTQWFWQLEQHLKSASDGIENRSRKMSTVPVTAGTFASVLRSGLDPLRGGVDVPEHVTFLNSIPTVGDCLAAIRKVTYVVNC